MASRFLLCALCAFVLASCKDEVVGYRMSNGVCYALIYDWAGDPGIRPVDLAKCAVRQ